MSKIKLKQARTSSGTVVYPHMPRASTADRQRAVSGRNWRLPAILAAAHRFVRFWASGEQSSPK